jgi:2-polyprenyl-3-methyl-5-hydroxy-6-metoxy-1,4-benzoquinol methylase
VNSHYKEQAWENTHKKEVWAPVPQINFLAFMARYYWGRTELEFLDLGCGTGANSGFLIKNGFKVTAVDFSESACTALSNQFSSDRLKVINADITILELDVESFDCVIAAGVLECLELDEARCLFRKVEKWLKPGGRLYALVLSELPRLYRPELKLRSYSLEELHYINCMNGIISPVAMYGFYDGELKLTHHWVLSSEKK